MTWRTMSEQSVSCVILTGIAYSVILKWRLGKKGAMFLGSTTEVVGITLKVVVTTRSTTMIMMTMIFNKERL